MKLGCLSIFAVVLGVLCSNVAPAWARGGSMDGGGGYLFRPTPKSAALEISLFLKNPGFRDSYELSAKTSEGELTKYSYIDVTSLPVFQRVKQILNRWRDSAPVAVQLIEESLSRTRYYHTASDVPMTSRYELPEGFWKSYPKGVLLPVVYFDRFYGPTLSVSAWMALGDASQAAIILKESLRKLQIGYGNFLSDKNIQDLIAELTLGSPTDGTSLDRDQFFDSANLRNRMEPGIALYKDKAELQNGLCLGLSGAIQEGRLQYLNWQAQTALSQVTTPRRFCESLEKAIHRPSAVTADVQKAYAENCDGSAPIASGAISGMDRPALENLRGLLLLASMDGRNPAWLFDVANIVGARIDSLWALKISADPGLAYDDQIRRSPYPEIMNEACQYRLPTSMEALSELHSQFALDSANGQYPLGLQGRLLKLSQSIYEILKLQADWFSPVKSGDQAAH